MSIYAKLKKYSKKHIVAMHMPGHKRHNFLHNKLPYNIDITEIDGFDNLHSSNGILLEGQNKLANLFGSKKSYYLVNGSTCGILASIFACCNANDKIITTTSCHKSVYHAIEILNLETSFIPIGVDEENEIIKDISANEVEKTIKANPDAKCVLITSPTYEGVISDIKSIAEICHKHNIPLIVDEAHGAHLFLQNRSALNFGADIVTNSLHKTLPSLTQTAVLHLNSNLVDENKLQHYLSVFMTSSPSYILMASIDECVEFLNKYGKKYINKLQKNINLFLNLCKKLNNIKILNNCNKKYFDYDNSKIVILANSMNLSGKELMQELRKNKIELEMSQNNYALAYATIFDKKNNFIKLFNILKKLDNKMTNKNKQLFNYNYSCEQIFKISDAQKYDSIAEDIKSCNNQVCAEYVWTYPPGIPILIPGQKITTQILEYIEYCKSNKIDILSTFNDAPNKIHIIKLDK